MSASTAEVIPFRRGPPSRQTARPEAMVELPADNKQLVRKALEIIEICRSDAGTRTAYYRQLNQIVETGKNDGTRSLVNLLYRMLDRLSSLMFSPVDIRFSMDFENAYADEILKRGARAATLVSRSWERTNTDLLFAQGVFESLKYGGVILKQWPKQEGPDRLPVYHASLVMPWQFGVYRPDSASLDQQPAMVETVMLTLPEVWRRIWHMPNARQLFDRIIQHAAPGNSSDVSNSFFHQVLSTSQIQTGVGGPARPVPGGIVQLSTDPNFTGVGPSASAPMMMFHEMWMWDQSDYTTVQIIEPDILIAPRFKRTNLLISGDNHSCLHPYTLIQPNQAAGNIWGRSEIADLIEPQNLLTDTARDIRRLFGIQVDKFLAITGDGITDEVYDQQRASGFMNLGPGGSVTDLTPKFPPEALPLMEKIIEMMQMIGGFDNLLSGNGQPGVRSGVQSNPLMRTASAPVRDRSLIIERQCASAADLRLSLMEAKDGRNYWTDPKRPIDTQFLLADLPEDRRIVVDGHTTSPIFADDHQTLIAGGVKMGIVDPESAIEQLPFQNKDILLTRLRAKMEKEAALLLQLQKQNPEEWAKLIEKSASGGHKGR
jgi:hypothetical protein